MQTMIRFAMALGALAAASGCATAGGAKSADVPEGAPISTAATAAPLSVARCDYGAQRFLRIPLTAVAEKCFAPRSDNATDVVRVPLYASTFESACAVTIDDFQPPAPTDPCAPKDASVPMSIGKYDVVSVHNTGANTFELVRMRDRLVIPLQQAAPNSDADGGTPYLHGSLDGIDYAVYLAMIKAKNGTFDKVYRIEMFDFANANDPALCRQHLPTYRPTVVKCPEINEFGGSQTGTSTGGEPPPR